MRIVFHQFYAFKWLTEFGFYMDFNEEFVFVVLLGGGPDLDKKNDFVFIFYPVDSFLMILLMCFHDRLALNKLI